MPPADAVSGSITGSSPTSSRFSASRDSSAARKLEPRLGGLLREGVHAREVVLAAGTGEADVLDLEFLDAVLGLLELLLVGLDLLVDEAAGRLGVTPLVADAGLDKERQQVLDDALGAIRLHILVRNAVDVLAAHAQ